MSSDPQQRPLRFCSRCGGELAQQMAYGQLRPVCTQCGFIVFVAPKVACGALLAYAGRVLLVRRAKNPGRGLWCLPCGFAEADEAPELAAQREMREETGLEVQIGRLLGAYHYTDDPRGAGILLIYLAECDDPMPVAGDDADCVEFFERDALPPLSHHTHRRALEDWVALFI